MAVSRATGHQAVFDLSKNTGGRRLASTEGAAGRRGGGMWGGLSPRQSPMGSGEVVQPPSPANRTLSPSPVVPLNAGHCVL